MKAGIKAMVAVMKALPCSEWTLLAFLLLAVFCLWPNYSLYYSVGYNQGSTHPMLKKMLFELLAYFFIFPCLLIIWIMGLVRAKHRRWRTILLGSLLIMFVVHYFLPSAHDRILLGFRDGMLHNYGPEEMRSFARDFDKLPKNPGNDIDGTVKIYRNRIKDDDLAKTGLKERYKFLANYGEVEQWTNIVYVEYGGFDNHWGFLVSTDGKKIDPSDLYSEGKKIRASDDIYFQSEY
jgi:hypothetical protein